MPLELEQESRAFVSPQLLLLQDQHDTNSSNCRKSRKDMGLQLRSGRSINSCHYTPSDTGETSDGETDKESLATTCICYTFN